MTGDHQNLNDFLLASTKMHLTSGHVMTVLNGRLDMLEKRLAILEPRQSEEMMLALSETKTMLSELMKDFNDRKEEVLAALEKIANG